MKGRQDSLEDVITLAANRKVFESFWFKKSEDSYHQHSLIITMMEEIADFISTPDFKHFSDKHHSLSNYIPDTTVVYMFNIFSMYVNTAKKS